MSSVIKTATETVKKLGGMREAMVHNIWLAGLGAYAKSADEVGQLKQKGQSLFDELIERGRQVERSTKDQVSDAATQTTEAFEARLHGVVQKLTGLDAARLEVLDSKIEQLSHKVEQLINMKAGEQLDSKASEAEVKAKPARPRRRSPAKTSVKKESA